MAVTYELLETFTGTRVRDLPPDPDNPGPARTETMTGVKDIEVKFILDTDNNVTSKRMVNVCFDSNGNYDEAATIVRIVEVGQGVENKMSLGIGI